MDPTARHTRDDDERARLVGRLSAGIAHDFNNILTAAYAALDALASSASEERAVHEWRLRQCLDRGAGLGRWLVAFGRLRGGPPDVVDPAVSLATAERLLARALPDGLTLRLDLRRDAGLVLADEGLVEQLLAVLLLAGVEFNEGAEELCLTCEPAGPGALSLAVAVDGRAPPASPELVDLAARLGGDLAPGGGSRLALRLPTVDEPRDEHTDDSAATVRPVTILLCEGDDLVREALGAQLRARGHPVRTAASLAEALDESAPPPALLVTELCLPDGDGPQLARLLKARRADLAVLFTASPRDAAGPLARDPAVDGALLVKPFRKAALVEALARLLR